MRPFIVGRVGRAGRAGRGTRKTGSKGAGWGRVRGGLQHRAGCSGRVCRACGVRGRCVGFQAMRAGVSDGMRARAADIGLCEPGKVRGSVPKGQLLALGEWKSVRKNRGSERGWGAVFWRRPGRAADVFGWCQSWAWGLFRVWVGCRVAAVCRDPRGRLDGSTSLPSPPRQKVGMSESETQGGHSLRAGVPEAGSRLWCGLSEWLDSFRLMPCPPELSPGCGS